MKVARLPRRAEQAGIASGPSCDSRAPGVGPLDEQVDGLGGSVAGLVSWPRSSNEAAAKRTPCWTTPAGPSMSWPRPWS